MIKFTMKDGRLQMTQEFLMIPEFTDVWNRDKTKEKQHAHDILFYVYLMCDLQDDCPTKNLDKIVKDQHCRFMVFKDKAYQFTDKDLPYVQAAVTAYTLLNETSEERILQVYDAKIDQLRIMLEEVTPVIREGVSNAGVATFTTNVDMINRALKEVSNLVKAKNELKQAILAGLSAGYVRGQLTLSPRDRGSIKIRK